MAGEIRLRLDRDGSVMLPAAVRKALGVARGGEVLLVQREDGFLMTTRRLRIEEAQRNVRRYVKPGVSLVDELIAERREEAKRELERFGRRG